MASDDELIDALVAAIQRDSPMQASALRQVREQLDAQERADLAHYLRFCGDRGIGLDRLSEAYRTISGDTLREQIHFRRTGRYRYSTFAEVADKVYFDDAYMARYMYGLALTQFLWPNHLALARFFHRSLAQFPRGAYLEVGPGHGAFFRAALRSGRFDECLGVDISPTSLAQTRALLEADGPSATPWRLQEADFLAMAPEAGRFATLVMGEVLEHVENPQAFLDKLHVLAAPGAVAFVTTAVNAPAVDHIWLFRSVAEVEAMAERAGFRVLDSLTAAYPGCTMEEAVAQSLPVNVALVLGK